jgi:hypothetical protein
LTRGFAGVFGGVLGDLFLFIFGIDLIGVMGWESNGKSYKIKGEDRSGSSAARRMTRGGAGWRWGGLGWGLKGEEFEAVSGSAVSFELSAVSFLLSFAS